ncbi:MAG: hypothetical protein V5A27_11335 [Halapricum sp.]
MTTSRISRDSFEVRHRGYLASVIVDAHEWSIDVEPSDIGGTRFSFQGVDIAHVE